MGRLRRLCGKITEVMQEDYGGYAVRLRRLYGKIMEVLRGKSRPSNPLALHLSLICLTSPALVLFI